MGGSLYSYGYGDPGSPYSYDFRDPGPHFHMNMGTQGPQSRGSPFSHDNGTSSSASHVGPHPKLERDLQQEVEGGRQPSRPRIATDTVTIPMDYVLSFRWTGNW